MLIANYIFTTDQQTQRSNELQRPEIVKKYIFATLQSWRKHVSEFKSGYDDMSFCGLLSHGKLRHILVKKW